VVKKLSNAMMSSNLKSAFDALQYLTNPYALLGFVFLIAMLAFSSIRGVKPVVRLIVSGVLCALVLLFIFLFLQNTLNKVRADVMIHAVRDQQRRALEKGVEVELVDIDPLQGKAKPGIAVSGHVFNKEKVGTDIVSRIINRAGVVNPDMTAVMAMDQSAWDSYLAGLDQQQAQRIKDIPFARFTFYRDNKPVPTLSGWYLKGDVIEIPLQKNDKMRLALVNVYNTRNHTSGEPEAVNFRVLTDE
jgi:hypothetical protein